MVAVRKDSSASSSCASPKSASPPARPAGESQRSARRGSRVDEPAAYHAEGLLYLPAEARFDYLLHRLEAENIGAKVKAARSRQIFSQINLCAPMRGAVSRCVPLPKHFAAGSRLRLFWENFMLQEGGAGQRGQP